jgi:hypothetical protein
MTKAKWKRKPTSGANDPKTKTHNSQRRTTARKGGQLKPATKPAAYQLSLPKIKSACIDGAAHQGQAALRCAQRAERAVEPAHPCLMRDAFGRRCSAPFKTGGCGASVARLLQQYGRGIPGGSSRSIAPHIRSARVSVERSDDRECQASVRVGQICRRNKHPDRGSDNEGVAPNHRPPSVGWRSIPPLGPRFSCCGNRSSYCDEVGPVGCHFRHTQRIVFLVRTGGPSRGDRWPRHQSR